MSDYVRVEDALGRHIPLEAGTTLTLLASDLRLERTGMHGKLQILVNDVEMEYSTFNLDRDEDRSRLANKAYKEFGPFLQRNLNGSSTHYTEADFRKDVRRFCSGLERARVDLDSLQAEWLEGTEKPVPIQFVLRPYVLHQGGTIVFAQPGNGKSYITGLMAVSIDAGNAEQGGEILPEHEVWEVPSPRRVLVINLERGADSVRNRLGNINAALGLPRRRKLLTLNARGKALADVAALAAKAIKEHGVEVVLLDSISRAGLGDLNENGAANKIIDVLNGLIPTWIAIAHAPRGSTEHVFGSIHFEAGADVMVRQLSSQEPGGPLGVALEIQKDNDVGKQGRRLLALDFNGEYGLSGVRQPEPGEFPSLEGNGQSVPVGSPESVTRQGRLWRWMIERGDEGATAGQAAQALGLPRQDVSIWFQRAPYRAARTVGRERYYTLAPPGGIADG